MVNEADIELAIGDLESQKKPNFTQIANKHNLHRSTLKRRFNGETTSHHQARSIHQQLLTDAQEEILLDHISSLSARGLPPTPQILKNLVVEIVGHPIGECWVRRFCRRYKGRIKSVYLKGIDQKRKVADNAEHIKHFYEIIRLFIDLFLFYNLFYVH